MNDKNTKMKTDVLDSAGIEQIRNKVITVLEGLYPAGPDRDAAIKRLREFDNKIYAKRGNNQC
jgi:hypothetical protein